jgi:hypothetical protein
MAASSSLVTSASIAGRGSEREGREREYTTQSPSRERKRVLEVSTDIFGGSTTAPRSFPTFLEVAPRHREASRHEAHGLRGNSSFRTAHIAFFQSIQLCQDPCWLAQRTTVHSGRSQCRLSVIETSRRPACSGR